MSKFGEYLNLVPKFFKNPDKVLEGWINDAKLENGSLNKKDLKEVIRRRAICEQCPFSSFLVKDNKDYENLMGEEYKTDRIDNHCTLCACNIAYKTACLSCDCGIEVLNQEHPDKAMELKWAKFKNE